MPYSNNVFINCPFDNSYKKILERLLFVLEFYEYKVFISTNMSSGHDRLSNIIELIEKSKFTFHDMSRHIAQKKGEYARFNMPFELGIDIGCFHFRRNRQDKVIAMLDSSPHSYDKYLSDMSGRDILYHFDEPDLLFQIIPEWLELHSDTLYDSSKRLQGYFLAWIHDYKASLKSAGHDLRSINKISIHKYQKMLKVWVPNWKVANNYSLP